VIGAVAPTGTAWHHGDQTLVDVIPDSESNSTVEAVRAPAHTVGSDVRVGGIVAQNSDFISAVYGDFPLMIALLAVLTFLLLARAFRSLLPPLKAVLLNVLSIAAAWGVVTLVWQKGYGSHLLWGIGAAGAIPSWLPLMVFAFLYGLSMDYEVFILARMREEYDATGSTETAVVNGIGRTDRLVTSAALILFLGFVAMSSAPSTQVKMIATGLGAGILFDATVIRALLVPAAVSSSAAGTGGCPRPQRVLCASSPRPGRSSPNTTEVKETNMPHSFALVLASGNGWHDGHWWIVFSIFWFLVLAIVVAFFWRRNRDPSDGGDSPRRILAERFARGEISGEEYRDRLALLQYDSTEEGEITCVLESHHPSRARAPDRSRGRGSVLPRRGGRLRRNLVRAAQSPRHAAARPGGRRDAAGAARTHARPLQRCPSACHRVEGDPRRARKRHVCLVRRSTRRERPRGHGGCRNAGPARLAAE
jgi:hypothetical protein